MRTALICGINRKYLKGHSTICPLSNTVVASTQACDLPYYVLCTGLQHGDIYSCEGGLTSNQKVVSFSQSNRGTVVPGSTSCLAAGQYCNILHKTTDVFSPSAAAIAPLTLRKMCSQSVPAWFLHDTKAWGKLRYCSQLLRVLPSYYRQPREQQQPWPLLSWSFWGSLIVTCWEVSCAWHWDSCLKAISKHCYLTACNEWVLFPMRMRVPFR